MYPPTPTALPPGVPMISVENVDYTAWEFTDFAIQTMNYYPNFLLMIQIAIIIIIVFSFTMLLIRLIQTTTTKDES